jgi:hypothetical protein
MDLLGFSNEKIGFLKIKIRLTPFKSAQPHRIPQIRIRCGQASRGPHVAGPALAAARDPAREPCGSVRCGPAGGRDGGGLAVADPGGSVVATPACGHRCTAQTRLQQPNQVFDEKPKRETATRGDLAGGESHGAWATGQDGQPQGST